jgi:membrane fusion protein, heavy metal efflux system
MQNPSVPSQKFVIYIGELSATLARRANDGISGISRGGPTPPASPRTDEICNDLLGRGTSMSSLSAIAAFLIIVFSTAGCSRKPSPAPGAAQAPTEHDVVILEAAIQQERGLRVDAVSLSELPEELEVTGRIGLNENLTSRVGVLTSGRVVKIMANVGDHVTKGTVLAQIASHEVHEIRSEYAKAIAEMQRRRAEQEYARNVRDRVVRLYNLKAASLEQVQRSETDLRDSEIAIQAAQAEINRVEESLRHLGVSSETAFAEYTTAAGSKSPDTEPGDEELVPVSAPIEGIVLQRMATPGMVVTPAVDLFIISDLRTLWINAEVPEKQLASIRVGQEVGIAVQAYPGIMFPARISLVGASLDPGTRTIQVRCEARDAAGRLKPEMYATIRINTGTGQPCTSIPLSAMQDIDGTAVVFVSESPSRFRVRPIQTGRQSGTRLEVLDGIKPGEAIATTGSFLLKSELLKRRFSAE